jgi:hypothetical protein
MLDTTTGPGVDVAEGAIKLALPTMQRGVLDIELRIS